MGDYEGSCSLKAVKGSGAFFNSLQVLQRDLSVLCARTHLKGNNFSNTRVLDAMCGGGVRAVRYALEVPGVSACVAVDLNPQSAATARETVRLSGAPVEVRQGDCNAVMGACDKFQGGGGATKGKREARFEVVDLDPCGSPAPFLAAAMRCVEDGGLLCVASTEDPGVDPALCRQRYGGQCFGREAARTVGAGAAAEVHLRLLLGSVQAAATAAGRHAVPLLSLNLDFFRRVYVRVHDGRRHQSASKPMLKATVRAARPAAAAAAAAAKQGGQGGGGLGGPAWEVVSAGGGSTVVSSGGSGGNGARKGGPKAPPPSSLPSVLSSSSSSSSSSNWEAGPLYSGPLHDETFVAALWESLDSVDKKLEIAAGAGSGSARIPTAVQTAANPPVAKLPRLKSMPRLRALLRLCLQEARLTGEGTATTTTTTKGARQLPMLLLPTYPTGGAVAAAAAAASAHGNSLLGDSDLLNHRALFAPLLAAPSARVQLSGAEWALVVAALESRQEKDAKDDGSSGGRGRGEGGRGESEGGCSVAGSSVAGWRACVSHVDGCGLKTSAPWPEVLKAVARVLLSLGTGVESAGDGSGARLPRRFLSAPPPPSSSARAALCSLRLLRVPDMPSDAFLTRALVNARTANARTAGGAAGAAGSGDVSGVGGKVGAGSGDSHQKSKKRKKGLALGGDSVSSGAPLSSSSSSLPLSTTTPASSSSSSSSSAEGDPALSAFLPLLSLRGLDPLPPLPPLPSLPPPTCVGLPPDSTLNAEAVDPTALRKAIHLLVAQHAKHLAVVGTGSFCASSASAGWLPSDGGFSFAEAAAAAGVGARAGGSSGGAGSAGGGGWRRRQVVVVGRGAVKAVGLGHSSQRFLREVGTQHALGEFSCGAALLQVNETNEDGNVDEEKETGGSPEGGEECQEFRGRSAEESTAAAAGEERGEEEGEEEEEVEVVEGFVDGPPDCELMLGSSSFADARPVQAAEDLASALKLLKPFGVLVLRRGRHHTTSQTEAEADGGVCITVPGVLVLGDSDWGAIVCSSTASRPSSPSSSSSSSVDSRKEQLQSSNQSDRGKKAKVKGGDSGRGGVGGVGASSNGQDALLVTGSGVALVGLVLEAPPPPLSGHALCVTGGKASVTLVGCLLRGPTNGGFSCSSSSSSPSSLPSINATTATNTEVCTPLTPATTTSSGGGGGSGGSGGSGSGDKKKNSNNKKRKQHPGFSATLRGCACAADCAFLHLASCFVRGGFQERSRNLVAAAAAAAAHKQANTAHGLSGGGGGWGKTSASLLSSSSSSPTPTNTGLPTGSSVAGLPIGGAGVFVVGKAVCEVEGCVVDGCKGPGLEARRGGRLVVRAAGNEPNFGVDHGQPNTASNPTAVSLGSGACVVQHCGGSGVLCHQHGAATLRGPRVLVGGCLGDAGLECGAHGSLEVDGGDHGSGDAFRVASLEDLGSGHGSGGDATSSSSTVAVAGGVAVGGCRGFGVLVHAQGACSLRGLRVDGAQRPAHTSDKAPVGVAAKGDGTTLRLEGCCVSSLSTASFNSHYHHLHQELGQGGQSGGDSSSSGGKNAPVLVAISDGAEATVVPGTNVGFLTGGTIAGGSGQTLAWGGLEMTTGGTVRADDFAI